MKSPQKDSTSFQSKIISLIVSCLTVVIMWLLLLSQNPIITPLISIIFILIPGYLLLHLILRGKSAQGLLIGLSLPLGIIIIYIIGLVYNFLITLGINLSAELPIFYSLILVFGISATLRNIAKSTKLDLNSRLTTSLLINLVVIIAGTLQLNNYGSNVLSIIGMAGLILHVVIIGMRLRKYNDQTIAFAIFVVALGIILGIWMRTSQIIGVDANREFGIFNFVMQIGYWSPEIYRDAYNACLSITVFPQIIHLITGIDGLSIYKVLIPAISATIPLTIYLVFRKLFTKLAAYYGSLLYLIQPVIFGGPSLPLRQQIAFLFFSAFLCTLFLTDISKFQRRLLATILGIGIIISHYSTGYIFLALLIVLEIFQLIARKQLMPIRGRVVIILSIFMLIWYGLVNVGLTGVASFAQRAVQSVSSASKLELQNQGSPFQLPSFLSNKKIEIDFSAYKQYLSAKYTSDELIDSQEADVVSPEKHDNGFLNFASYIIRTSLPIALPWLALIGIWRLYKSDKDKYQWSFLCLSLISTLLLVIFTFLPYISVDYSLSRLAQQFLLIIGPLVVVAISYLLHLIKIKKTLYHRIIIIAYFAAITTVNSGLVQNLLGGPNVDMRYQNSGVDYARYANSKSEVTGNMWLAPRIHDKDMIVADIYTGHRTLSVVNPNKSTQMVYDILDKDRPYRQVIIAGKTATEQNVAITPYKGVPIVYTYPSQYFQSQYNSIYSNSSYAIYRNY